MEKQKRQVLQSQSKEIISRVIEFMKKEAARSAPTIPLANYQQRVMAATGISRSTFKRILKESKDIKANRSQSFSTPYKNKKSKKCPKSDTPPPAVADTIEILIE